MTTIAEDFGAWLIKCAPTTWDLARFVDDGNKIIEFWSVRNNSRSRSMQPGEKIVFWVSGTAEAFERGIWGIGRVTGLTHDAIPSSFDPDGYWLNEAAAEKVTNYTEVHIPLLLDAPVTDADLRAAGVNELEVQVVPGGSNPSWISKDQLSVVERLLPPWPDETDVDEEIAVSSGGAGFGTAAQNAIVEKAAMDAVMNFYDYARWAVQNVSKDKVGWDLTCTAPDGQTAKVEVKGVTGDLPIVLLTANELRAAQDNNDWLLVVVTRALSAPAIAKFDRDATIGAAKPYVFRADMRSSVGGGGQA